MQDFSVECKTLGIGSSSTLLGGYPKNSDGSPNTRERERVLSTFEHTVRM
jgi:hypothetical protein